MPRHSAQAAEANTTPIPVVRKHIRRRPPVWVLIGISAAVLGLVALALALAPKADPGQVYSERTPAAITEPTLTTPPVDVSLIPDTVTETETTTLPGKTETRTATVERTRTVTETRTASPSTATVTAAPSTVTKTVEVPGPTATVTRTTTAPAPAPVTVCLEAGVEVKCP